MRVRTALGLRSLSWGVWTCSSQPRNHHPASQERLPQCGTARVLRTSSPNACPETRRYSGSRQTPGYCTGLYVPQEDVSEVLVCYSLWVYESPSNLQNRE